MEGEERRREDKTAIEEVPNVDAITCLQLLSCVVCFSSLSHNHSQKLGM